MPGPTETSGPVVDPEIALRALDKDMKGTVGAYLAQLSEIPAVDAFLGAVRSACQERRRDLEDEGWKELNALAQRFGKTLPGWVAERVEPTRDRKRTRNFDSVAYWANPITGAWSLKLGKVPAWATELMRLGYTEEQLIKPPGTYSTNKGQAFWINPSNGRYWLNTRPQVPTEIQRLLDQGMSIREVCRPPGTFEEARGYMEPSALLARKPDGWDDPIPEPAGEPVGRAVDHDADDE